MSGGTEVIYMLENSEKLTKQTFFFGVIYSTYSYFDSILFY